MVNGGDASACGVERSGLAGWVDGDAIACARGLAHGSDQFVLGVLEWSGKAAVDERVLTGLVDLDEVHALLNQFVPG